MSRYQGEDGARRRRVWPWVVLGVAVLVLGAAAWTVRDVLEAREAAAEVEARGAAVQDALAARDVQALRTEAAALEEASHRMVAATDGPHWWVAARLPWIGDQARPLVVASRAMEAVAADALVPLASMQDLDALEAPAFVDGVLDPYTLEPYRETLAVAADAVAAQVDALDQVSLGATVPEVRDPFLELAARLREVDATVGGAHVAAELLPSMLGGEGPRHYLVVVQNNAEPRATGGIPGALMELTVAEGRMVLGRYLPGAALIDSEETAVLTDEEREIFTEAMARFPQDANFTPQFPRTAEILRTQWEVGTGEEVDAVISVDPVALGWMLEGAPPLDAGGFAITADTVAEVVLNQAYFLYDTPAAQDTFFASVSSRLFATLVGGRASSLDGAERAIEEGRLLLWSAVPAEQDLLETTLFAGATVDRDDALGVFVNDGSGSKIGWYIERDLQVTDYRCADGTLESQRVTLTLTHAYDGDVADLPDYISGGGVYVPAGEFHANVLLMPAEGTSLESALADGDRAMGTRHELDGRELVTVRVELAPGESTTLQYTVVATEDVRAHQVIVTPGPREEEVVVVTEAASGC
ncbi:DUF4012 domain-containing protein [Demequina lignilytica]|uniref:DUF4012 domain-containing protein n=1 Tax=Demequina lignilytica TaxID=3051663 RepID=A0AB35MK94_9MICO|nr:DUF4012 domain-containing protein [Demequina sp. SYSU T0a273]MDN4484172.1 DUF4012 domain-containing protein [Demequina sp. SYSU T0a273]